LLPLISKTPIVYQSLNNKGDSTMAALTVWKFDTVEGGGENERRTLTMNDVEKSKMLDVC
jgi:hypothetical protein